jgi:hypothetical protein
MGSDKADKEDSLSDRYFLEVGKANCRKIVLQYLQTRLLLTLADLVP